MSFDEELNRDEIGIPSTGAEVEPAGRAESLDREPLQRMLIRNGERAFFLATQSIRWIEADDDFVKLHVAGQSHRIRTTLSSLFDRLSQHQFLRINRSAIVNIEFVAELRLRNGGDYEVILLDGTVLRLSRRCRNSFQKNGVVFGASRQR